LVWNEKVFLKEFKCDFEQMFVQLNNVQCIIFIGTSLSVEASKHNYNKAASIDKIFQQFI